VRLWLLLVVMCAAGWWGCKTKRDQTRRPSASVADASACGDGCGPMDLCRDGVCTKNPFWTGLAHDADEAPARATCPYAPEDVPAIESHADADIPQFDATATRVVDMGNPASDGERLGDDVLDEHLAAIHDKLIHCIDLGACYVEDPPSGGDFDFRLRLSGTGEVTAVSVETSPALRIDPVVACARRSAWELRFPAFDGTMTVTYAVTID
jgi:hypothetical protein